MVKRQLCYQKIHQIFKENDDLKVEKFLKASLESIQSPSPSVKIQIMGEKVCLRCKGKTLLGILFSKVC
jgi:hypothetical protein